MKKSQKKWLCYMVLLLVFCLEFRAAATTEFGFNYWPAGYSCDVLYDSNWTTASKNIVKRDLDIMASYSAETLRLMVWPQVSGYLLNGQGGYFTDDFNDVTTNFLDIVEMCHDRDIKIILSFGNNYCTSVNGDGYYWWQVYYGNDAEGFTEFLGDTRTWMNGFIDKIEESNWADTVVYYDYLNEWSDRRTYGDWYIEYVYVWTNVPSGKRYVSLLTSDPSYNDAAELKNTLGDRVVDALDFHSYPLLSANSNIEYGYDLIAAQYPGKPIYLGEFGASCEDSSEETQQESTVTDLTDRAITKGFAGMLHWMLWDNAPPAANQLCGWGYSLNSPKDVMGGMTDYLTNVPNPDMEVHSNYVPVEWGKGGTVSTILTSSTPATNLVSARLRANYSSGAMWLTSGLTPVTGGAKFYVNSYIRSNMQNVSMTVTEYNSSQQYIKGTGGPSYTPAYWMWYNYLDAVGDWSITLDANTAYVIIGICGTLQYYPSILDVDTVSAW